MKNFIKVMKALSDPNRVKIVKMLQHKLMCVCEMQEALQLSQPSVSKHLKILEDAGLVDFKKDGLWVKRETFVLAWFEAVIPGKLRVPIETKKYFRDKIWQVDRIVELQVGF